MAPIYHMALFYVTLTLLLASVFMAYYVSRSEKFFGGAGGYLMFVNDVLSDDSNFDTEVSFLQTNDIPTLSEILEYLEGLNAWIGIIIFCNILICGLEIFGVYNTIVYGLHMVASVLNAALVVNFFQIRKWKWQVSGACKGYSVLLQAAEYIREEEAKNQQDEDG